MSPERSVTRPKAGMYFFFAILPPPFFERMLSFFAKFTRQMIFCRKRLSKTRKKTLLLMKGGGEFLDYTSLIIISAQHTVQHPKYSGQELVTGTGHVERLQR